MTLYDALKASKGLPVSDSYAALWEKKAESVIKTLAGRLPLFFRTSETKLRDWVIYGNNDVGKNLLEITAETQTINGITYTINDDGTVTVSGTATADSNILLSDISGLPQGNYILSGEKDRSTTMIYPYVRGGGGATKSDATGSGVNFSMGHYTECKLYVTRNFSGTVTVKPMIRLTDTSSDFEPYQLGVGEKTENGYVLNIGVGIAPISSQPAVILFTRKTINLGESPLTEGQTLSMLDFGDIETVPDTDIYIAAFEGFNYDDQLSYNQPRMRIKYKEYKE
jgi:hypothetical protein